MTPPSPLSPAAGHGPPGDIVGSVQDEGGAPVASAVVMLTGPSPPHRDIAALTSATGGFTLGNLLPGSYTVAVNAVGYRAGRADVEVSGGSSAALTVVVERDHHG